MIDPWKLVVRTWKGQGGAIGRPEVERALRHAAGPVLRIRDARRRLLLLTNEVSRGKPAIVEGEEGLVLLISLNDVLEIVMDPSPTLQEVMMQARPGP